MMNEIQKLQDEVASIELAVKDALGSTEAGTIDTNDVELIKLEGRIDAMEKAIDNFLDIKNSIAELKKRVNSARSSLGIKFAEQSKKQAGENAAKQIEALTKKRMSERLDFCYNEAEAQIRRENPHLVTIIEETENR